MFSTVEENHFGTVPFVLGFESFARGGLMEHRYRVLDVCDHSFWVFEGGSSSKGPSVQAFGMDSATGYASILFGIC